jgi:hypothetical protein
MEKKEPHIEDEIIGHGIADETTQENQSAIREEQEKAEAIEVLKKITDEENDDEMGEISFKTIFGGDILQSRLLLKQIIWFMFVVVLMIIYTANRYSAQQATLNIAELREKLQEVKYNVLTQSSDLMNLTRQSNVEKYLKQTNDSTLLNPTSPPFLIRED